MAQENELLINEEELTIVNTEELSDLPRVGKVKGRAAGITSIVFTSLATIAFIVAMIFFMEFISLANTQLPQDPTVSEGLSKGLGQVFAIILFIIFGALVMVLALVGLILSIFGIKWSKVAGFILLGLNVCYTIAPVILLVVMLLKAN